MDPQFTVSREELYHVQMDVKHVQAVQINHAERLVRLEKRQADDALLKSVWGTGSPFPGVLSGTPQQGPVQHPSTDVFDDFDEEQGQNLLGSLQLETDEEPVRRGASRANSVRFDVSALQGSSWASASRISGDFAPIRPGSGLGSHPMTERSLSHKSDGRHSSAGHSVHSAHSASGRTSSLGLDTNFMIGGQDDDSPLDTPDPPPGLFILGSVPSIIRCWLTTNFSHNALLYAAVCTGSQRSILDFSLVKEFGLTGQIQKDATGRHLIRLPVYLPEAVVTQPSSRSNSPAPQLPTLSADFEIAGMSVRPNLDRKKSIRIFIGSDTLRAHNADILFSQNLMTLYGVDRNKLSVPFVRPEDESSFKNLCTSNVPPEKNELKATAPPFTPTETKPKVDPAPSVSTEAEAESVNKVVSNPEPKPESKSEFQPEFSDQEQRALPSNPQSPFTSTFASEVKSRIRASSVKSGSAATNGSVSDSEKQSTVAHSIPEPEASETPTSETSRRESASGIWGSWRQGTAANNENEPTSGYQRATRGGRSMKVLKPSKSISTVTSAASRSSSAARTGASYEPVPSRISGESRRKSQVGGAESAPLRWESKRATSEEVKKPLGSIATIPRSSNPIGGASAFAWMNPNKPKTPATTAE